MAGPESQPGREHLGGDLDPRLLALAVRDMDYFYTDDFRQWLEPSEFIVRSTAGGAELEFLHVVTLLDEDWNRHHFEMSRISYGGLRTVTQHHLRHIEERLEPLPDGKTAQTSVQDLFNLNVEPAGEPMEGLQYWQLIPMGSYRRLYFNPTKGEEVEALPSILTAMLQSIQQPDNQTLQDVRTFTGELYRYVMRRG